jgi:hypothetical protein
MAATLEIGVLGSTTLSMYPCTCYGVAYKSRYGIGLGGVSEPAVETVPMYVSKINVVNKMNEQNK